MFYSNTIPAEKILTSCIAFVFGKWKRRHLTFLKCRLSLPGYSETSAAGYSLLKALKLQIIKKNCAIY